jgi:hypothetical protein
MQTVHYAAVGFLIACMVWAAAMVFYKAENNTSRRYRPASCAIGDRLTHR